MSKGERTKFYLLVLLRALVAFLDLIGILAIGLLATSVALTLSTSKDLNEQINYWGVTLPAVSSSSLSIIASVALLLFTSKAILSILITRQLAYFLARIEARAAKEIARSAFGKGIEGARISSREEIVYAVQNGSPSAFTNILNSIGTLTAESFLFILILTAFAFVNPLVAAGAVIYFGLIGIVIQLILGRKMQSTGYKLDQSSVEANTILSDLGEVLREATILGQKDFFYNKIFDSRLRASGNSANQLVMTGMPRYIVETALIVAIAFFVLIQASSGEIVSSAATIGVFLAGGLRLTSSLLPLQSALLIIKQATPPANRALDFLATNVMVGGDLIHETKFEEIDGPLEVSISELNFSYQTNDTEALTGISLEIAKGSQVAIFGTSGGGKSTLADLILGLLKPTSGVVELSGVEPMVLIKNRPGLLGYVPQRPGMISGTIYQNIVLGLEPHLVDRERLNQAIDDAHLTPFINSLPDGLNTDIGKRKDELSGGQLQRIGLARALYSQPKLLVMDEATSALDAESENEINRALDKMRGKVTVILIAHRLNTIQKSDKVFLLEEGKISASGVFAELLRTNKTVEKMAKLMAIEVEGKK
jgi:ATP-binding cassette subfamily C protein